MAFAPAAEPDPKRVGSGAASLRSNVVWAALQVALDRLGPALSVVDAGGGTGGFAVPVASLGHRVTVVDPSPDSLAALARRAAEQGCSERISAVQGDLDTLGEVVAAGRADAVLCHSVLELDDDPAAALRAMHAVLRPGGLLSVLATNHSAAVLARAVSGRLAEALQVLRSADGTDPGAAGGRRFHPAGLTALVEGAGFGVDTVHNVRVFTDLLPAVLLERDLATTRLVAELEQEVSARPDYAALAAQLHLLAHRS